MKRSNVAMGIICTLNITLFIYAATAKLLDYYEFHFGLTFTIYIAAMLLSGSDIPCSCGGVLEEMSWGTHIIFNCFFVALSAWGIYLQRKKRRTPTHLPALA